MLLLLHFLWRVDVRWAGVAAPDLRAAQRQLAGLGGSLTRSKLAGATALVQSPSSAGAVLQVSDAMGGAAVRIHRTESLGPADEWKDYLGSEHSGGPNAGEARSFRPLLLRRAGRTLYVGSVGEEQAPPEGCSPVWLLDDGESFLLTTAHALHATTRMLLNHIVLSVALQPHVFSFHTPPLGAPREARVVLDYGCGSAVLALAALRLGLAQRAHAVDVYPPALRAAWRNGILTGFDESQLCLWQPYELPATVRAQLALANMLPGPLISVAAEIAARTCPGGTAVLTGFRAGGDAAAVRAAFEPYFEVPREVSYVLEGWVAFICVRSRALVDTQGQAEEAVS
jgi:ribosomal protein L11 methylase PrmA